MSILEQLGLNHTYFYQLAIFIFALIALGQFVFKDYVDLLAKRDEKTKGSEDIAVEYQKKAADLSQQFEIKARKLNGEIKTIFDTYREEAHIECENIVNKARQESQKLLEETKRKVSIEITEATKRLQQEIPQIATLMTQKLLSKSGKG